MAKNDVPNQETKTTNQNYTININQLYKDWIGPIDEIRSYGTINNRSFASIVGSQYESALAKFTKAIKIESSPQESRCHAFYRWIGFPVVNKSKLIYSPGFDIISCKTKHIDIITKIAIAKNPLKGFDLLSDTRENYVHHNLKIFSVPSIAASTMALSSGGTQELRKFSSPFENGDDHFDMLSLNQTNTADTFGIVGGNHNKYLGDYKDAGGNKILETDIDSLFTRPHIIKPFIVDARIDFSITPQSRLVAVPFVPDDSYLKVSSTKSVRRPLIEKFIRDRSPLNNSIDAAGTNVDKIKAYVDKDPSVTNRQLINNVKDNKHLYVSQNLQNQFIDSLDIMKAMMKELAYAREFIRRVQGLYYWVPYPSAIGPEGGSKVQGVFLPDYLKEDSEINNLTTEKDKAILDKYSESLTTNINIDSAELTGSPESLDYGISATSSINISATTTAGMGNNNAKSQETMSQTRFRELTQASNALRAVEIIMGEFSGLGLCDIVAITGALKILPLENLCGLLDDSAFERMKQSVPSLKETTKAEFEPSMIALTNLVKDFYLIMDSFYKDAVTGAKKL